MCTGLFPLQASGVSPLLADSLETRSNSMGSIVRLSGTCKPWAASDNRAGEAATGRPDKARSPGAMAGKLFEACLEALAGNTDSGKWNGLRLMKWCKGPLASKRLFDILTHDSMIAPTRPVDRTK